MALELGGGRVPAIGFGISLRGQAVGVAVVVELLAHIEAQKMVYVEVTVECQAVGLQDSLIIAVWRPYQPDLVEWQGFGHGTAVGCGIVAGHHADMSRDGQAVGGGIVAQYVAFHVIGRAGRCLRGIGLSLLHGGRRVVPPHLTPSTRAIVIDYPRTVGQTGRRAGGGSDANVLYE